MNEQVKFWPWKCGREVEEDDDDAIFKFLELDFITYLIGYK